MAAISGISPWPQGDLAPIWTCLLVPDTGYFNVSGLVVGNFSMTFRNLYAGLPAPGVGSFSNITPAVVTNGVIISHASVQYQPGSNEVAMPGNYVVWVNVLVSGGRTQSFLLGEWDVIAK